MKKQEQKPSLLKGVLWVAGSAAIGLGVSAVLAKYTGQMDFKQPPKPFDDGNHDEDEEGENLKTR